MTFFRCLNALDTIISGEEQIIFFKVNHSSKLHPVLIRPSRVGLLVTALIDDAVQEEVRMLFMNFYDNNGQAEDEATSDEVQLVGRQVEIVRDGIKEGWRISMAVL